ncbi:hypothetical protein HNY73_019296 [Argiope bruennichi]|uniref:Uncharacterized protein n=1 Tax=Argiope bruennichi TaxID=94029 RepID=A0A8T0EH44_ARGBR|nr:hypothetical protein HNY73_019296 [Argiope bruennichi]
MPLSSSTFARKNPFSREKREKSDEENRILLERERGISGPDLPISSDSYFKKTEPEKPVAGFSEPFFHGGGGRVAQNQDSGGLDQKVACDCRCAHDVTGPYRAAHAHTHQPTAVIYRVRVDHGKWNPLSLEAKRGHLEFPPGIESNEHPQNGNGGRELERPT